MEETMRVTKTLFVCLPSFRAPFVLCGLNRYRLNKGLWDESCSAGAESLKTIVSNVGPSEIPYRGSDC